MKQFTIPGLASVLGLLTGADVTINMQPAEGVRLPLLLGSLESLNVDVSRDSTRTRAPLPIQASAVGQQVQLGWKPPALLLAPVWLVLAPHLLLPLLLVWLVAPGYGSGEIQWEAFVSAQDLTRGVWRWLLGRLLDAIGQISLPGILARLNADGSTNELVQLPRSTCTGVAIAQGGKLMLDGRSSQTFGAADAPQVERSLEYTVRMGLSVGPIEQGRSCLLWDTPELKISLGSGGWAKLLPKLWVPVAVTSGVLLPRSIALRRVTVSEAGDGVTCAGTLELTPKRRGSDGPYPLALQ